MRFHYIGTQIGQYPLAWMCRLLHVSRSGYYAFCQRKPSARSQRDAYLTARIRESFASSKCTYGSPHIWQDLQANNERVDRRRVIRLMQREGIFARVPKRCKTTTDSNHEEKIAPNIVDRNFTPSDKNTLWAADISYIRTWTGWSYLAVVLDLYSRRVVGWSISNHMKTSLPLEALQQSCATAKTRRARPSF